jgi:5-(carboxyamino)imidazole ribonucleotide synthase
MARTLETILPGACIGLLGGGQLARMTALAARAMGYRIAVLDPDPQCAAAPVVDGVVVGAFDDPDAAAQLARAADVVSYEIERLALPALEAAAAHAPLRPGAEVLTCIQDRARQKTWLAAKGYPVAPWTPVASVPHLEAALQRFGACRVKRTQGGYDGRAQMRVTEPEGAAAAWSELAGPCVAEQELDLDLELSALVARSPRGELTLHPPALNHHERGTLVHSLLPAPIEAGLRQEVLNLARSLAEDLQIQGLLAVECFVTRDGRLWVNELSPRPHNTFHGAGASCATSQFEQYVRALCNLPLGSTETHGSSVLVNLLGDLWQPQAPPLAEVLALPGVSLHLYGKVPKPHRKVGHLVAWGESPGQAMARAVAAMECLGIRPTLASAS